MGLLQNIRVPDWLTRLSMEPPFRLLTRQLLKRLPVSVWARERWDLSPRPAYLLGLLTGAEVARYRGVPEISAIEFGVAGGQGLLTLQEEAEAVERETGVSIKVYGFDYGGGLPSMTGDYRDHPDYWKVGDFPMDKEALRGKLSLRTRLILGDVKDSVSRFIETTLDAPIGFVSFDLDLYSSTIHAFKIFTHSKKRMLPQVPLYFDDVVENLVSHKFASELLAIEEFNAQTHNVKIDQWRGVKLGRPFPELPFLDSMYVAYDLEAITATTLTRGERRL